MLITIAKAAENLVSCQGTDCQICSLLETVSNIYNFFLGTVFSVAVFFLVIAGILYIMSSGKSNLIEKSKLYMKGVLFGFAFIIAGWVIIHASISMIGYKNSGSWWNFQCEIASLNKNKTTAQNYTLSPAYQNVKTFPSLAKFINSNETRGKIAVQMTPAEINEQIKELKPGQRLRFLAPVRYNAQDGSSKDTLMPVYNLLNNGSGVGIENTGSYLDILASQLGLDTNNLDLSSTGIGALGNQNLDLTDLGSTVREYLNQTGDSQDSFSQLLALALDTYENENNSQKIKEVTDMINREVVSMLPELYVEKGEEVPEILNTLSAQYGNPSVSLFPDSSGNNSPGLGNCPNIVKDCPADQCIGGKYYTFDRGKIECDSNGKVLSYSCSPQKVDGQNCSNDSSANNDFVTSTDGSSITESGDRAADNETGTGLSSDKKDDSTDTSSTQNPNTNSTSAQNDKYDPKTGNLTSTQSVPKDQWKQSISNKNAPKGSLTDNFTDSNVTPTKDPLDPGDFDNGDGSPEAIKRALRRIEKRDRLRYEMIFRFVAHIGDDPNGGLCTGCGDIYANHNLKIYDIAHILVHEGTHSGHACTKGWGGYTMAQIEGIACANQMGSTDREKGHKDMREFVNPQQPRSVQTKKGKEDATNDKGKKDGGSSAAREVRGHLSRYLDNSNNDEIMSAGDLPAQILFMPWDYAYNKKGYQIPDGPDVYHYGDHKSGIILNVAQHEEDVVETVMNSKAPWKSCPPKDLPEIKGCNAPEIVID